MPHITVEYSINLQDQVDVPALVDAIHRCVIQSGLFELQNVRTRAAPRTIYRIAEGDTENVFIHVTARIRKGRTVSDRRRLGSDLLSAVKDVMASLPASMPIALSVEVQEIDPEMLFRHVTITRH